MSIAELLQAARQEGASDLTVREGIGSYTKVAKKNQALVPSDISREEIAAFCAQYGIDLDAVESEGRAQGFAAEDPLFGRVRAQVARDIRGTSLTFRLIPSETWPLNSLRLPDFVLEHITNVRSGLIALCGEVGSGKTSVWQSWVADIFAPDGRDILTLEDPVEFKFLLHLVRQYQIGSEAATRHLRDFLEGLKHQLRLNTMVVILGEIRDAATATAALLAAESGALVIVTLHVSRTADFADRFLAFVPSGERELARTQLGYKFAGALGPRLVKRANASADEPACVLAYEWLPGDADVRSAIRAHDTKAISEYLVNTPSDCLKAQLLEDDLASLVVAQTITLAEAESEANDVRLLTDRLDSLGHR